MEIKTFLKSLSYMHLSLVVGLVIFTIIAIAQGKGFNTSTDGSDISLIMVPVLALLGYFGSKFLFKKMISSLSATDSLETKLKKFQTASHLKYMLIEIPAFFALFVYYSSGNALPLVIAVCLLAYLFVQKPNKEAMYKELPLNNEEKNKLRD